MAPMSLMTYEDARPWARAIKQRTSKREMPPWGADPSIGKFKNDPSLSQAQIDTIAAWVDAGAPEGSKADLPQSPHFTEGWTIGKPDAIFLSKRSRRKLKQLRRSADNVIEVDIDQFGRRVEFYEFDRDERLEHDLIDPNNPHQRVDLVYPILLDLIVRDDTLGGEPLPPLAADSSCC